ncbi:hypothetical protein LCGC14_1187970 [marine sediment metagenome]|uniref:Uncharacterized protein n=1 Tax=marine sediment metagenome TaxID=412755 RepID=A0A0F9PQP2_9ZZZZ
MKKGDTVVIIDGSFTRSVVDGELIKEYLNCGVEKDLHYMVIEINCRFPKTSKYSFYTNYNNTVIQAVDSGKVVFIEACFLRVQPPEHHITVGDFSLVLSDEEYAELKEQLL